MKSMILALSLWTTTAFAVNAPIYDPTQYRVVPDNEVIEQLNPSGRNTLKSNFSILVWNSKKASSKEAWRSDLVKLAAGKSFVLIQEGMQDDYMPNALKSVPSFGWTMAKSFYMNVDRNATGVITGSIQDPVKSQFLRSRDVEPVIKTPKVTLLNTYALENGQLLLVANIHGINFQTPEPFYRQIDDLMVAFKAWPGHIVFAGDFNTWIPARLDYLKTKAEAVGLHHVEFAVDTRPDRKKLDHIFVRGCEASNALIRSDITSSDHPPLTADLACAE